MPTYGYYTYADYITALANRLADPNKVFWTDPELTAYGNEALRFWQTSSQWLRDRFTFQTVNGTAFYDLYNTTTAPNTLLPTTLTRDLDIVPDIQYALMEPIIVTPNFLWTGTEMFTLKDVCNALWNRVNQFLLETASVLSYSEISTGAPTVSRVTLADTVIDVRRAQWKTAGNVYSNLWRADENQFNSFNPGWSATAQAVPTSFSTILVPPLSVQVAPVGNASGTLALTTIVAQANHDAISGFATGTPLDWNWALKFGVLADLLSRDGEARDLQRSAYAEQRYQEGVKLCRLSTTVTNLELAGTQIPIDALTDWDAFNPGWQNTTGTPVRAAMAGRNLLALYPVPNGTFTITVDCVRNAVTSLDTSQFQLPREHLDVVLDYAEHLARFKQGGQEFEMTFPLYERTMRLAADHNSRLRSQAEDFEVLADKGKLAQRRQNMRLEDATAA